MTNPNVCIQLNSVLSSYVSEYMNCKAALVRSELPRGVAY